MVQGLAGGTILVAGQTLLLFRFRSRSHAETSPPVIQELAQEGQRDRVVVRSDRRGLKGDG
ncbi:hypothetical protein X734_23620 [Mesorhizobium sp. L2C084A000]|nr:hypothetical protein X734_23620 [Mesorhizobium sp. L2C084A000]